MTNLSSTRNISCALDFFSPGKRSGFLSLRYSDNRHAYSIVPIPVGVIVGGEGPTIFLSAGSHGDEYEGQVALRRLFWETEAQDINGRMIILPALNYPAVRAGERVSPLDGGNLNRAFPGSEGMGPTAAIADYVTRHLLPICDAGFDIHSGGSTAVYLPSAYVCTTKDKSLNAQNVKLASLLNTQFTFVIPGNDYPDSMDFAAHQLGIPLISAELGGGGTLSSTLASRGLVGVRNMMRYMSILSGEPEPPVSQIQLDGEATAAVMAKETGIFECTTLLGTQVKAGQAIGTVFPLDDLATTRTPLTSPIDGIVYSIRQPSRVLAGDILVAIAPPISP